jgi:flagellar biosynthesis protein FlhG
MGSPSDLESCAPLSKRPRVVSISSGKGGVGKTSFTLNLGLALTRLGQRVQLLDGNLGLGNIDVHLGLTANSSIKDFFNQRKRFREIVLEDPHGISIIPAGSGFPELTNLDASQRISLLNEIDSIAEQFNFMLIDVGPGISSNVLYFNMVAQESIIVVTPEPTSIANAIALIKTLLTKHVKNYFMVLVNLVANENEARELFKILLVTIDRYLINVSIDYLGFVPLDSKLAVALKNQTPVLEAYPDSPSSKSFVEIAKTLLGRPVQKKDAGLLHLFE